MPKRSFYLAKLMKWLIKDKKHKSYLFSPRSQRNRPVSCQATTISRKHSYPARPKWTACPGLQATGAALGRGAHRLPGRARRHSLLLGTDSDPAGPPRAGRQANQGWPLLHLLLGEEQAPPPPPGEKATSEGAAGTGCQPEARGRPAGRPQGKGLRGPTSPTSSCAQILPS